jgi:hypothetical protein
MKSDYKVSFPILLAILTGFVLVLTEIENLNAQQPTNLTNVQSNFTKLFQEK